MDTIKEFKSIDIKPIRKSNASLATVCKCGLPMYKRSAILELRKKGVLWLDIFIKLSIIDACCRKIYKDETNIEQFIDA